MVIFADAVVPDSDVTCDGDCLGVMLVGWNIVSNKYVHHFPAKTFLPTASTNTTGTGYQTPLHETENAEASLLRDPCHFSAQIKTVNVSNDDV